jgi:Endonuclease I
VRRAPLEIVEGIEFHDSLRLEELGIDTCYDLATSDYDRPHPCTPRQSHVRVPIGVSPNFLRACHACRLLMHVAGFGKDQHDQGVTSVRQCALSLPTAVYPGHGVISEKNRKLLEAWDTEDPVDAWEPEQVRRIEPLQGNTNPFVK